MANAVSHITFLYSYFMHGPFVFFMTANHLQEKLCLMVVVIIFQFFKACYTVQKYTCVNKHTIFDNGTKK